jgi:hypothetical protein
MLPAVPLAIIAPTGGEQLEMGMVLPMAAMRVEHRDVTTPERLASDRALEVIQALPPAAHQGAQHDRGVLVEVRAKHGWDRQEDVPRDHPLVEDLTHLADPGVDGDFGTPQAQGRFTAHRDEVCALATGQAAVRHIVG